MSRLKKKSGLAFYVCFVARRLREKGKKGTRKFKKEVQ